MATISFNIPDAKVPVVAQALGYTENIPDPDGDFGETIPNPVTEVDWIEQSIIKNTKKKVNQYWKRQAAKDQADTL